MPRAIRLRNDEHDVARKSYWVLRNMEQALARAARDAARPLTRDFSPETARGGRGETVFASIDSVVSIGLAAHERLADVIRASVIYLDPPAEGGTADIERLAACGGRAAQHSRVVLLGPRAGRAAPFLPAGGRRHDLPPVDLSDLPPVEGQVPRLTVVNHLADQGPARAVVGRLLERGDVFLDCFGIEDEAHNRVRYLGDAEVGEAAAVHIHVGGHRRQTDRLRICDSWQSRVPVLFLDVPGVGASGSRMPVRDEHDVLVCGGADDACRFLALLLDTPALRRLLTGNGRASAAPEAAAWTAIAGELAA